MPAEYTPSDHEIRDAYVYLDKDRRWLARVDPDTMKPVPEPKLAAILAERRAALEVARKEQTDDTD